MNYNEIEHHFKDKKSTEELLEMYETVFIDIDTIDEKGRNNQIETEMEINKVISQLTSFANQCSRVADIADTYKTGEQARLVYEKIQNWEKKTKPNMTQLKAEASEEIHYLRRVRNLFRTYAESAGRSLSTYKAKLTYKRLKNYNERKEDE